MVPRRRSSHMAGALLGALVLACALAFAPPVAVAEDVVTEPYPGVRHIHRTTATPERIHIIEVDLDRPTVRVRATKSADRGTTVSTFASDYGCQVATNADFFSFSDHSTSGLAMGHGEVWGADSPGEGFLAIGRDNRAEIAAPAGVTPPEDWVEDAVGGRPLLVEGGQRVDFDPCTGFCARNPRTAVGLSEDGDTLYMVVVDGRSQASAGMTLNELGALMLEVGAHRALNLDGGGSSTLVVAGEGGVQNAPSDGSERVVANHLGVCIVEPVGTLVGYVREDDIYDDAAGVAGATVTLSSGQSVTTEADGRYQIDAVPRGDVTIRVGRDGFRTAERTLYVTADDLTWGSIAMTAGSDPEPGADAGPESQDQDPGNGNPAADGGTTFSDGDDMGGCSAGGPGGSAALVVIALAALLRRRRSRLV